MSRRGARTPRPLQPGGLARGLVLACIPTHGLVALTILPGFPSPSLSS